MPVDIGRGHFMLVRLHSQGTGRQSVGLSVERITVIQLHAVTVREEETIAAQHAAAIRGALLDSIVSRALHKASEGLDGGFGTGGLLRKRRQPRQRPC